MTSLPNLPHILNRRESKFSLRFRAWWQENPLLGTFELKDASVNGFLPFDAVEHDQIAFALSAHAPKGILARVTVGTKGTADYIGLRNFPAWIVVNYKKAFHIISINSFLLESRRSKRRSLTEDRAAAIATISVQ